MADWFAEHASAELWLSVPVVGKLRQVSNSLVGVTGPLLKRLIFGSIPSSLTTQIGYFRSRRRVAQRWAVTTGPDPVPVVDGLLAATALEHDLILVTRNLEDVGGTGVRCANPFSRS